MKKDSRHLQLKSKLLDLIKDSTVNTPLPSERSLAKDNHVCRATVAKVMVELEREGYVVRRPGKGSFVSPRDKMLLNASDQPIAEGNVVMLYPDFFSYIVWQRVHFAEMEALRNNLNLLNLKIQQESNFDSIFRVIAEQENLRGVIISPGGELSTDFMKQLDSLGIPIVLLGMMSNQSFKNTYTVQVDYYKSGYLKVDYLVRNGHRKLGMVFTQPANEVSAEHLRGVKQALYDNGLRYKDLAFTEKDEKPWQEPIEVGYRQTIALLKKHSVTGILFDSTRGALGGLRAFYELGVNCPEDISMVASQSSFGHEEMTCPAMSTVSSNTEQSLKLTMDIILDQSDKCKNYRIDVQLFERESVRNLNDAQ